MVTEAKINIAASPKIKIKTDYDFLIVGSGFAGSVMAERIASQLNKRVMVVEKREHIGGNAYDFYDSSGVLVHKYGPHIFHTNYEDVWKYISSFADWNGYQHRVLAYIDGKKVPVPINLTTVNTMLDKNFTTNELMDYFESVKLRPGTINNSKDVIVSQVGEFFYEKIFKNYSFKQWGVYPDELLSEVTERIPVKYNSDDRYFSDRYQGLPLGGYTKLFEKLLSNSNITVMLNMDYKSAMDNVRFGSLIYTGPIDYFFDYKYGKLPYRSLELKFETLNREQFQEAAVINYPNDYEFTRITEFKHMTLQRHPQTTILREYPSWEGDPYYPTLIEDAVRTYNKYKEETLRLQSAYFIGRLAEYKYYNMDKVIKSALDTFELIAQKKTKISGSI